MDWTKPLVFRYCGSTLLAYRKMPLWKLEGNKRNTMKRRLYLFCALLLLSVTLFAQKDVTRFMGIPVDGFKSEMIQKLKAKGFVSTAHDKNVLQGEFNGTDVYVSVGTNNNKVYRIMVADANSVSETDIRIRFNNLCRQFKDNPKYISFEDDCYIPEDEDISYEMLVNNKRYQAVFCQQVSFTDSVTIANEMKESLLQKYTEDEIANFTETELNLKIIPLLANMICKKRVWFMISEFQGKYYISMFYDNLYNKANGEDL